MKVCNERHRVEQIRTLRNFQSFPRHGIVICQVDESRGLGMATPMLDYGMYGEPADDRRCFFEGDQKGRQGGNGKTNSPGS